MIRKVETEAEYRSGQTEAPRLIYPVGFHAVGSPSFLQPILMESDGKGFFVRGKWQESRCFPTRFLYRVEEYNNFIARRSFVYSYCWNRIDFTGIFMDGGCCVVTKCTMAFGKGKREMSEIINYKIRKGYTGIPCNTSISILF